MIWTLALSLASSCGRCGLADRSNGAELFGWCFTKVFIESVPTPDSETDRQRVHFPARQEGIPAHDAGATSVAPPRSLSLSYGAYGVFLVLVEQHHHFPSSGLDDVCGFFDGVSRTMGSTVGHLASPQLLLLLLYKMELFCDSRSRTRTRYTHTNTHAILLLLLLSRRVADLQERKKSLSGSSEEFSERRNQKELLADTRTHGKLLYAHGKLSLVTASPWLSKN